jgi:hypothetical protein
MGVLSEKIRDEGEKLRLIGDYLSAIKYVFF